MKLRHALLAIMLVFTLSTLWAGMMPPKEEMAAIDIQVDKLMAAFNAKDSKAFYADWSPTMAALCTPAMFKIMFMDMHMKNYGAYQTRKIVEAATVIVPNVPNGLLVYEAKFEKNPKVKIAINLIKEKGQWLIQQVTIQAIP